MKKITKLFLVCLLLVTIVGCGSGTKAQEEVIHTFFEKLASGDTKSIKKLTSKRVDDEIAILDFIESVEDAFDWDYGKSWNKERKVFVAEIFEKVIDGYEITDIETKNDKTTVKVKGKRLKYESFVNDEMFINDDKKLSDFSDDMMDALDKYLEEEYTIDEYIDEIGEIYNDYAPEYFKAVSKEIEDLKTTNFNITFTLKKKDGEWLIDEIGGKKEWPLFADYDYGDDEDNDDFDYKTYTVDQEKCKAENTKLGKGRLLDSYKNEKNIQTTFEFLDYNVTNSEGVEADKYDDIKLTDPLKIDIEVAGKVGDQFVLAIEDEEDNVIFRETITLTEEHMVITKEITGYNTTTKDLYAKLMLVEGYNEDYNYGKDFGYFFIWNK